MGSDGLIEWWTRNNQAPISCFWLRCRVRHNKL